MTLRRWVASVAAPLFGVTALAQPAAGPGGPYQPAVELPHLQDATNSESSGVAASRRNPGILWTHNDSGGKPLLYAVDREGNTAAVFRVRGAKARDWEDMAYGPGPRGGGQFLYIGDIGDNQGRRTDCVVYRVPEPKVVARPGTQGAPQATDAPTVPVPFRYPDGPQNAEALLVHPRTGVVYIVTKAVGGVAGVYRFPLQAARTRGGVAKQRLAKVGTVRITGEAHFFPNLVTGGDIAPDGRRVVLCTYAAAYEWTLPPGAKTFDAIWKTRPARIALPALPQCEAVCYTPDGKALIVTSENVPARVYRLDRAQ